LPRAERARAAEKFRVYAARAAGSSKPRCILIGGSRDSRTIAVHTRTCFWWSP
jgi:hypothetical protein